MGKLNPLYIKKYAATGSHANKPIIRPLTPPHPLTSRRTAVLHRSSQDLVELELCGLNIGFLGKLPSKLRNKKYHINNCGVLWQCNFSNNLEMPMFANFERVENQLSEAFEREAIFVSSSDQEPKNDKPCMYGL